LLNNPDASWDHPALSQVTRRIQSGPVMGYSLRTARYTMWAGGTEGEELYDYDADPSELRNLASERWGWCRETAVAGDAGKNREVPRNDAADRMRPLGLSINGLARDLRVPVTRMSEIVNGAPQHHADTAARLARCLHDAPVLDESPGSVSHFVVTMFAGFRFHLAEPAPHRP
jgi:hypothetical protein